MKNGLCPRCGSRSIHAGEEYSLAPSGVVVPDFLKKLRVTRFLCRDCGLLESYLLDPAARESAAESWPQVEAPVEPPAAAALPTAEPLIAEPAVAEAPPVSLAPSTPPEPPASPRPSPPPRPPRVPGRTEVELSLMDRVTIRQCLEAMVDHQGLADEEVQAYFGVERDRVRELTRRWPEVDHGDSESALLILRVLEGLAENPRGKHEDWKDYLGAKREDVEAALAVWRELNPQLRT